MSESGTQAQGEAPESAETEDARKRTGTLVGGHDPRAMALRSAEVRRAKREAREQRADLDALTVKGRLAVAAASKLGTEELERCLSNLLKLAQGDGHVAVNATRTLVGIIQGQSTEDEDVDIAGEVDKLTPSQRASAMAAIRRAIQELEGGGGVPPLED